MEPVINFVLVSLFLGPIAGGCVGLNIFSFYEVLTYQIIIQIGTIAFLFLLFSHSNSFNRTTELFKSIINNVEKVMDIKKKTKKSEKMFKRFKAEFENKKGLNQFGFYLAIIFMTFIFGIPIVALSVYFMHLNKKRSFLAMCFGAIFSSYVWTAFVYGAFPFLSAKEIIAVAVLLAVTGFIFSRREEKKLINKVINKILKQS